NKAKNIPAILPKDIDVKINVCSTTKNWLYTAFKSQFLVVKVQEKINIPIIFPALCFARKGKMSMT
ncbi:hypothetical protein, partial [Ruminococcus flavefaciens]|uniref:hypothetical protein n=1 Tax=Ruminococcus flavefaciens TaxID=1265 RepID=UPI0026F2F173